MQGSTILPSLIQVSFELYKYLKTNVIHFADKPNFPVIVHYLLNFIKVADSKKLQITKISLLFIGRPF